MRRNGNRGVFAGTTSAASTNPTCSGKRIYSSWSEAQRIAKSMNRRVNDGCVQAYQCRVCGEHHIGTATIRHTKTHHQQSGKQQESSDE